MRIARETALPFGPQTQGEGQMGFKYQLATPDGDIFVETEFSYMPRPGEAIIVNSNRHMRVVSVIPVELASEFVDKPIYGVLEVNPSTSRPA